MRIGGLGGCLSTADIYQYAVGAGFPSDVAVTMTAVAMRESGGCPGAHNHTTAEDSYGLWQINVQGNPGILSALGISAQDLFDPSVNAAAAFYLYGGNPANLDTAWYINRPGYQEAYLQYLPAAQAAADSVTGASDAPVDTADTGSGSSGLSTAAIAAGLALLALFVID